MKILGIETSCDETAAAVVCDSSDADKRILSNIIFMQTKEHAPYGGVVPEIASRAHINHISDTIKQAMKEADTDFNDLDAIAVTAGPGLIGGVIVGVMVAKAIASASNKPLIAINHLEGHALTTRILEDVKFPFLMLLVSGGHCQIIIVENIGEYRLLGGTIDDALGEAFDKTAKMLNLGYPGGPIVEEKALAGNPERFVFPRPIIARKGCDFSFSGLKTAVLRQIEKLDGVSKQDICDICASFQYTCGDIIENRISHALEIFESEYEGAENIVIAGGVAANKYLKNRMLNHVTPLGYKVFSPPINLCTDNAAMIAWAGIERMRIDPQVFTNLNFAPKARWSLSHSSTQQ